MNRYEVSIKLSEDTASWEVTGNIFTSWGDTAPLQSGRDGSKVLSMIFAIDDLPLGHPDKEYKQLGIVIKDVNNA